MLQREGVHDITIVEPSEHYYYQPLWAALDKSSRLSKEFTRPMQQMIGESAIWVQGKVSEIKPELNKVVLENGATVDYDYLVVAAGIQVDWDHIDGLKSAILNPNTGVLSIYDVNSSATTWSKLKKFKGGNVLFTMPSTSIKCSSLDNVSPTSNY